MQLSKEQIQELKQHWPFDDQFQFHRRVANFVYFASIRGKQIVLRLTEQVHRKEYEIESELDWMSFLTKRGMSIARPIPANDGALFHLIDAEKKYIAAVFEKAPGAFLDWKADPNHAMIETWGKYVGQMHRLTKEYRPPSNIKPREQWADDESLSMALRSLDPSDEIPYRRMNEMLEWMRSLPQDKNNYGLIHCDLHQGNFFVNQGQITAFDFDDACYQWFTYDIIAPLNSIFKNSMEGVFNREKENALQIFMKGYELENKLEQIWIDRIPIFDQYRAVMIYHWAKTCLKENVFDASGIHWAKDKLPKLFESFRNPEKLF